MPELLEGASLVLATIGAGLIAGVFWLYAHTIMPALAKTDDRTFVGAFQAIDRAIINPLFVPTFLGTLVVIGLAGLLQLGDGDGSVLPWIVVAFALYSATVMITIRVHVPRNDDIKAAGDPDRITDLAGVRSRFDEHRWARWNVVRAVTSTTVLGCLAWALAEYGRTL